ncbi:hypothetical protein [Chachezhania sediminis]|uniref:hypothetical protein n=1 Tax=Chachezhania sediminis TaxID=2599291 RepID=UPI00131DA615|nr:hypothetical protein [Chachezhania sediminis]
MIVKTVLTALLLTVVPALSYAMGCGNEREQQVQSCATGTHWDPVKLSCAPIASS